MKDLLKSAWIAAVNEADKVQEMGFKYTPLTFEQWFDKNFTECDLHGHSWQPIVGWENSINGYICTGCGKKDDDL